MADQDQLSLDLNAALPSLPSTLRPMLPRLAAEPFDSADHLFEPSWSGERALAFVETANARPGGNGFRMVDRFGRDVAPLLPELADLPQRLEARSAIVDGELVVVDAHGRADARALEERLAGLPGPAVAYLVFDLLYVDGRPLLGEPLARRRELLARTLHPGDALVTVPSIAGEGRALYQAVAAQGIGGVMARHRQSPYLPGVRSRLWRFVAREPEPTEADETAGREPNVEPNVPTAPTDERVAEGAAPVIALIRRLPLEESW